MFKDEIKNVTIILAFATSFLYVYGITYYQSFLAFWGVEETQFPISFERTLFQGFVGVTHLGAVTVAPLLLVLFVCFVLVCVFATLAKTNLAKRLLSRFVVPETNAEVPKSIRTSGLMLAYGYWGFVVFVLILTVLILAERFGLEAGKSHYKKYSDASYVKTKVQHRAFGELQLVPIVCNDSHCAFFNGTTVVVYPLDEIIYFESKPKV